MIIDCIADLHGHYPELEGGDLLIVAGDLTARDIYQEYIDFFYWLHAQKYRKKIFISGNHDNQAMSQFDWFDAEYLCDSGTEFEGLKIWGSPYTPWFHGVNPKCKAFMKSDESLSDHWDKIPMGIDILITHGPAFGILDGIPQENGTLYHAGSKSFLNHLNWDSGLKLHIFGHIHEAYGEEKGKNGIFSFHSINCSHVNGRYKPVNKPIRIEL